MLLSQRFFSTTLYSPPFPLSFGRLCGSLHVVHFFSHLPFLLNFSFYCCHSPSHLATSTHRSHSPSFLQKSYITLPGNLSRAYFLFFSINTRKDLCWDVRNDLFLAERKGRSKGKSRHFVWSWWHANSSVVIARAEHGSGFIGHDGSAAQCSSEGRSQQCAFLELLNSHPASQLHLVDFESLICFHFFV